MNTKCHAYSDDESENSGNTGDSRDLSKPTRCDTIIYTLYILHILRAGADVGGNFAGADLADGCGERTRWTAVSGSWIRSVKRIVQSVCVEKSL